MVSTTSAVVIALLALVTGAVLGVFLWRSFGPHQNRNRDLEKRLEMAEQRLGDYQSDVTEHFVETSRRVNELTRNYRDVHEYLASSAVKLTTPSVGREMRAAAQIDWSEPKQTQAPEETWEGEAGRNDTAETYGATDEQEGTDATDEEGREPPVESTANPEADRGK